MMEDTLGIEMEYEEADWLDPPRDVSNRRSLSGIAEFEREVRKTRGSLNGSRRTARARRLCFEVDDIDAALDELKAKEREAA